MALKNVTRFEEIRKLPSSIQPLAMLGVRASGAAGYALYELDPVSGFRWLRSACGQQVPEGPVVGLHVTSLPPE